MVLLLATLLAVFVGLVVLFWVGAQWAQGFFYDSVVAGVPWRAAAAGGAIIAFLLLWCLIEYANPGRTDAIHNFNHQEIKEVDRIISVRKSPEGEREIVYQKRPSGKTSVYLDADGKPWAPSSSGAMVAIVVEEGPAGAKTRRRFKADMDEKGNLKREKTGDVEVKGLRYREEGGNAYILESNPGMIVRPRTSMLLWNILLNTLHLVLWWVVIWLLLRFQWSHAIAFALVCWLAFTLALVPFLISRTRTAAEKKTAPPAALYRLELDSKVA